MIRIKKYIVEPPFGHMFERQNEPMNAFELRKLLGDIIKRDSNEWLDWDEMVWSENIKKIIKCLKERDYNVTVKEDRYSVRYDY